MVTSALAGMVFADLGVSVSIFKDRAWRAIHTAQDRISEFEAEYGNEYLRWRYNDRCITEARAKRRAVRGEHMGCHDLFVPIEIDGKVSGFLVAGPFAIGRATARDLVERWNAIAHTHARTEDPGFARYLTASLTTLTLEGKAVTAFERFMTLFALLLGGSGNLEKPAQELPALAQELLQVRAVERMWENTRSMIEGRSGNTWAVPLRRDPLHGFGIQQRPEHAIVGLLRGLRSVQDPIEAALRRDAFQRAAAEFAWKRGNTMCGPIGEHGVAFLSGFRGNEARTRAALHELAMRAGEIAKRFGFRLHAGITVGAHSQSLSVSYRAALATAERALSKGASVAHATPAAARSARELATLRARLAQSMSTDSDTLLARFERYADAVVVHSGYQLTLIRAHLQVGLELMAEPLLASGQLDRKSFDELCAEIDEALEGSPSTAVLVGSYRRVVADLERIAPGKTAARQERSLRRAIKFIREHLGEPLSLKQVARIAGFAPNYFSKLLKRNEGVSFERLLLRLRIEHAKNVLAVTALSIESVAHLSGFKSRPHFQQAFKRQSGETPKEYRERAKTK
jgi:AraC-like DNA-binding protein